jgi:hypothetical protein
LWPSSWPACTVLARPGLRISRGPNCSSSGPRLSSPAAHDRTTTSPTREGGWLRSRSSGARLGWRGGRGGGAYRSSVGRGGGVDGVDSALRLSWRRRGGSVTYAEDRGGESGGGKECGGSRRCLPAGTEVCSSNGGGTRLQTAAATRCSDSVVRRRGVGPWLSGECARRGDGRRQTGAVGFRHGAAADQRFMARARARPCRPGAARGTPGGGSALMSGPGAKGKRLTGGTPRQILF